MATCKHNSEAEGSSPLQVVVDTSVIRRTRGDLTAGDWPVLRAAARLGLVDLRLPSVVLQELVDHRRRDLAKLQELERKVDRQRRDLLGDEDPLSSRTLPLSDARLNEACAVYAEFVSEWFRDAGSVLDDPDVAHSELVARALERRRPFTEGERGYRDALIWYSALECASSERVVLLTANTKDFAKETDNQIELADDLIADLVSRGLPPSRIRLVTTTESLLGDLLPDWDEGGVRSAWASYVQSKAGVHAINNLLEYRLGREFSIPPSAAPTPLWELGLRSVEQVTSVYDIRTVAETQGWYRVHARASCQGLVGGYAWSWGDPDGDHGNFVLWDDWGGLTAYYVDQAVRSVEVVMVARFRPLLEVEEFEIDRVDLAQQRAHGGTREQLSRVRRAFGALHQMLALHLERPDFINDVCGDNAAEFELVVSGIVADWEDVADAVPGRYQTLVVDNIPTVIEEVAGLRALRRDLQLAMTAIDTLRGTSGE